MRILGYTYEADVHCFSCAAARFGMEEERPWVKETAKDSEGNPVHPIFSTDETAEGGEVCGTCGAVVAEPWGSAE